MLSRIAVGRYFCAQSTDLGAYRNLVGDALIDEVDQLAARLRGVRVCHQNATAAGGGVAELLRALAACSQTMTLGQLGLFSNSQLLLAIVVPRMLQVSVAVTPFEQRIFDVPAHSTIEWTVVVVLALTPVALIETAKLLRQRTSWKAA